MRRALFLSCLLILTPFSVSLSVAATISPVHHVTENGITLLILERPSLPLVHVSVLVKAGSIDDPEEKAGLAYMTAVLLDEGTKSRTSAEISEAIDFIGAHLSVNAREDFTTASLRVLKKDIETGLDLLFDILVTPLFSQEEIERKRGQIMGSIIAEKEDPGAVVEKAFNEIVFGTHPYHRPVKGTEETLPRITREDIIDFHSRYYRPNNTIIAVVGDVKESEAKELITRFSGRWEKGEVPSSPIPEPGPLEKRTVRLIDRDLTQANVLLGHVGIKRTNPDFYAVQVMNYILGGGGFASRILTNIRDNQGLAYSASSHFDANTYPGSFFVSLQTKNESAQKAIEGVLSEIRKIQTEPVSDQELAEARSFLTGSFPLRLDTNAKLANLLTTLQYFGLGLDYIDTYPDLINKVTTEDVLRVAQKYLDPDRFALVVAAKQAEAKLVSEEK